MFRFVRDALRQLRSDERGNVFILFGACVIPLMLVMGGVVDLARYTRHKAELSSAVDSAALALARQHSGYNEAQAETFVTNYLAAFNLSETKFTVGAVDVVKLTNGFHVTTQANMQTVFLPLGQFTDGGHGISNMGMNIVSQVVNSTNRLELALVFDNTGSMNCGNSSTGSCADNWSNPGASSRIVALKAAAHTLVNTLMTDVADPKIKIAMVPFEGSVNTGYTSANVPTWIDWNQQASAYWNGRNFSTPAGWAAGTRPGNGWLYSQLKLADSSLNWEGCVEMRAEPYDIQDTTPTTATPATLFVPYLWPDEPDRRHSSSSSAPYQYNSTSPNTQYNSNYKTGSNGSNTGDSHNYEYLNNYLKDKLAQAASSSRPAIVQSSPVKYIYTSSSNKATWHSGRLALATAFPRQAGPNFGCPRPIVPLTMSKATVNTAIDNMIAYYSTGTFIPVGLVWGWHVLTKNEPFTQGLGPLDDHYEQTVKAIVLFTDGENYITSESNNHNLSRFSGYNYTGLSVSGTYRLGSSNVTTAVNNLDTKTASLCTNVKQNSTSADTSDDIRVYPITFGNMSTADEDLMRNCATLDDGERLYYHAPTTSVLEGIFNEIGEDLSEIHLSM